MSEVAVGRGRGKVILLGEHSVVHGRPALAAGLELGVDARARWADEDGLVASPWGVDVKVGDDAPLARGLAALLEGYPRDRRPIRVELEVALPGGAGLGCSAAIGVAVTRALDALFAEAHDDASVAERSMRWERVFHGNPSGVDNAMAAAGGVALFRRGEPLAPVRVRRPLHLVIAHSGESSSTKEIVDGVARQLAQEPARIEELFDAIAALVRNAALAVEHGDVRALGQLMDMNQALLSALMLSTERLERLCAAARGAGALGAKLTGAGAGGCMIALATDADAAETIRAALAPHAANTWRADVQSRSTDP